jgi:hypothetical protein
MNDNSETDDAIFCTFDEGYFRVLNDETGHSRLGRLDVAQVADVTGEGERRPVSALQGVGQLHGESKKL